MLLGLRSPLTVVKKMLIICFSRKAVGNTSRKRGQIRRERKEERESENMPISR